MKYKNILFDLDGTLTDPKEGIINSVIYAMQRMKFEDIDKSELLHFIGPPLLESFIKQCKVDRDTAEKLINYYREYFSVKGKYENVVYKGVPEMLSELKNEGADLYVATSKPTVFAVDILKFFNLDKFFIDIVGCNIDNTRTQKVDIINHVINSYNLDKIASVMVGDRMHDLIGAEQSGIDSIAVTYGYGNLKEFEPFNPITIINSVSELNYFQKIDFSYQ